jgi:uncharacterized Fe-S cluster protein YjdI
MADSDMEEDARKRAGVARAYRDAHIAVYWAPQYCMHSAVCLNAEPEVFDARRRPWIELDGADADRVAAAVVSCPSGALTFERLDGGEEEEAVDDPIVMAVPDGPLYVLGNMTIRDERGNVIREGTRMALCRCGQARNKPFCDGTHRMIGFRSNT